MKMRCRSLSALSGTIQHLKMAMPSSRSGCCRRKTADGTFNKSISPTVGAGSKKAEIINRHPAGAPSRNRRRNEKKPRRRRAARSWPRRWYFVVGRRLPSDCAALPSSAWTRWHEAARRRGFQQATVSPQTRPARTWRVRSRPQGTSRGEQVRASQPAPTCDQQVKIRCRRHDPRLRGRFRGAVGIVENEHYRSYQHRRRIDYYGDRRAIPPVHLANVAAASGRSARPMWWRQVVHARGCRPRSTRSAASSGVVNIANPRANSPQDQ